MNDNNLFEDLKKDKGIQEQDHKKLDQPLQDDNFQGESQKNDEVKEKSKDEQKDDNKTTENHEEKRKHEFGEELKERKEELRKKLQEGMDHHNMNSSNNGGKNGENNSKRFKNLGGKFNFKGFIMLLFIITLIMSLPSLLADRESGAVEDIGYSQFNTMLEQGKITKVDEKEGYIYGYEKDDEKAFKARMITDRLGNDQNLLKNINASGAEIKSLPPQQMPFLLNILMSWFPMLLLIGVWVFMLNKMNKGSGGGPQIFNMGKSKAKDNGEEVSKVTFDDVAGITEAKEELKEVVQFLREPERFKKIGAKIPKGVLLLGAPGTGKTLLAKAVAGEAKVPFFSMSGSEFVEMFVGVGASRVRDLFNKARKSAPCIIFIDEIDAVGRKRGSGQGGGNDEREQTLNQLLVEMDGFGTDETIIVLAATNRPEILDRALMRPGRFDRQVVVDAPDIDGREAILKVHVRGKKLAKDVDLRVIAKKTPGFVGADLANLLNEAAILAARENREEITMNDLEEASEKVSIGPERKSKKVIEKERRITAYHEAGHAVMHYALPNSDPVHKITIVPRGMAGGYTMALPEEDRSYKSKNEFLDDMRILYGGRAAEQLVFGDITTGASNDIERATAIAHAIVTRFGMNEKFGPILLDNTKEGDYFQQKYYSDVTGKEVDQEIFNLVKTMYSETLTTLRDNYDKLDRLAKTLLEKEHVNREEFEAIMQDKPLPTEEVKKDEIETPTVVEDVE